MLFFANDYGEGACPQILDSLVKTNMEHLTGYGSDIHCTKAKELILEACGLDKNVADVALITGGTQTNAVVIASMLDRTEGVIAATTGHVAVHEAGAIEYTGHKVITVPAHNGKVDAADVEKLLSNFYADDSYEHMVFPGMLYISHPTEYGTLYTKNELTSLKRICERYKIPLFVDGARLGYGLVARDTDVDLKTLSELADVFYIGGTKVGALCGEAVVFTHGAPQRILTRIKQQGALLAKGRLLGVQFETLFTDNLYLELAKNAISTADRLREILKEKNYRLYMENSTNQVFVVLHQQHYEDLKNRVQISFWEKLDESNVVVRFATSWATTMEDVEKLKEIL